MRIIIFAIIFLVGTATYSFSGMEGPTDRPFAEEGALQKPQQHKVRAVKNKGKTDIVEADYNSVSFKDKDDPFFGISQQDE